MSWLQQNNSPTTTIWADPLYNQPGNSQYPLHNQPIYKQQHNPKRKKNKNKKYKRARITEPSDDMPKNGKTTRFTIIICLKLELVAFFPKYVVAMKPAFNSMNNIIKGKPFFLISRPRQAAGIADSPCILAFRSLKI